MRNTLAIELSQCMLLSGTWVYLLGDLKPGDTRAVEARRAARSKARAAHPETWKSRRD